MSGNESAAASKGVGEKVATMNVNSAAGLDPSVMTLRLKELAQTVLNWVAISQTAHSPAGCLSLTLPSWHCHLQRLSCDFSRPNLSRPRFHSYIRITCRSCVSFSTNWAKGNRDLKGRGWTNINQISSLLGPNFEKSLCPHAPLIGDGHFSTFRPHRYCQGKDALRATGNLSS